MPNKQLVKHKTAASLDKKSGSLAYNQWIIKELGLITNCPLKVSVKFKGDDGKTHSEERKYTAERTPFQSFNPYMVNKLKQDKCPNK